MKDIVPFLYYLMGNLNFHLNAKEMSLLVIKYQCTANTSVTNNFMLHQICKLYPFGEMMILDENISP